MASTHGTLVHTPKHEARFEEKLWDIYFRCKLNERFIFKEHHFYLKGWLTDKLWLFIWVFGRYFFKKQCSESLASRNNWQISPPMVRIKFPNYNEHSGNPAPAETSFRRLVWAWRFPALKRLSDEIRGINECDFSGILQGDISMFARAAWLREVMLSKRRSKTLQNHVRVDVYSQGNNR